MQGEVEGERRESRMKGEAGEQKESQLGDRRVSWVTGESRVKDGTGGQKGREEGERKGRRVKGRQ